MQNPRRLAATDLVGGARGTAGACVHVCVGAQGCARMQGCRRMMHDSKGEQQLVIWAQRACSHGFVARAAGAAAITTGNRWWYQEQRNSLSGA